MIVGSCLRTKVTWANEFVGVKGLCRNVISIFEPFKTLLILAEGFRRCC